MSFNELFLIIVICFIIIIIFSLLIGYYFNHIIVHPKVLSHKRCKELEIECNNIQQSDVRSFEENVYSRKFNIQSVYGYEIHARYIPNGNSRKIVILVHGITVSLYTSLKYVNIFLDNGFGVILYDHRNHGLSGGKNTSFGYYEKYDLKSITDWAFKNIGKDISIGMHGESMGASTVLQNLAIDDRISFAIEDCGYSDLSELFEYRLKSDYKVNSRLILRISNFITKIVYGWQFKDVSPKHNIKMISTPILFVHGDNDTYVPTRMARELYSLKPGIKKLYIAKNSAHAESFSNNKKEYKEQVENFLKSINMI